jgi:hypothetical protein
MRQMTLIVPTGSFLDIGAVGDYVRIKSALVTVRVEAPDTGEFLELEQGDACRLTKFNRLLISHSDGSNQTVSILIGNGTTADSAKVGGSVSVAAATSMNSAQATVTTASATIATANSSRKFLLIQNNDATGIIYVNLQGATATALNGVKIPPGSSLLLDAAVPSNAITAIGSIASNPNVVLVTG